MPDMNLTTLEGALVAVDALVKQLKSVIERIEWAAEISGSEGYMHEEADKCRKLIATLESLPKEIGHAPNP